MYDKFKKLFDDFTKVCEEQGFIPNARIVYKPEIRDSLNAREKRMVEVIVSNYLTIEVHPVSLNQDKDVRQEKGSIHEKNGGKNKRGN